MLTSPYSIYMFTKFILHASVYRSVLCVLFLCLRLLLNIDLSNEWPLEMKYYCYNTVYAIEFKNQKNIKEIYISYVDYLIDYRGISSGHRL